MEAIDVVWGAAGACPSFCRGGFVGTDFESISGTGSKERSGAMRPRAEPSEGRTTLFSECCLGALAPEKFPLQSGRPTMRGNRRGDSGSRFVDALLLLLPLLLETPLRTTLLSDTSPIRFPLPFDFWPFCP